MTDRERGSDKASVGSGEWPPKYSDVIEIVKRITIPDKWTTDEKSAVTTEYLQDVARRLTAEAPITIQEFNEIQHKLYGKISHSKQPDAQYLWDLLLERRIRDLARVVEETNLEKTKNLLESTGLYKEVVDPQVRAGKYWRQFLFAHQATIEHMLDGTAGIRNESILKLGELLMDKVIIPGLKKAGEWNPQLLTKPIESQRLMEVLQLASCLAVAEVHLGRIPKAEYRAREQAIFEEAVKRILSR